MKRYFRHKITGKVESFPERYGRLFEDVLEPVDDPGTCLDCGPLVFDEDVSEPEVLEEYDFLQKEDE